MTTQKWVVGNWKMHGGAACIEEWTRMFMLATEKSTALGETITRTNLQPTARLPLGICPPFCYIELLRSMLPSWIMVGAQDIAQEAADGAHTGEVSGRMIAECGGELVIIGHSERRAQHGETDAKIAAKLTAAVTAGLTPILCVGEEAAVRANGQAEKAVTSQLDGALATAAKEVWETLVIAYEPLWAIGGGGTAGEQEISEMHRLIHRYCVEKGKESGRITVLYGGSVKSENVRRLAVIPGVSGFLVGGASLSAEEFTAICDNMAAL